MTNGKPQCNYRCGFRAHRLRMKSRGEMDRGFYERVVGELVDAGVGELGVFYIGESFMCDWLAEAIGFARRRGRRRLTNAAHGLFPDYRLRVLIFVATRPEGRSTIADVAKASASRSITW